MKAIAIIEIPDGGKGKWYIDGMIRYTEDESLMKKFDADMIPLKPMPEKHIVHDITIETERDAAVCSHGITLGHNYVIEELEK